MGIPVLRHGGVVIATPDDRATDADLLQMESDLLDAVGEHHVGGVVIDVGAVSVLDSFSCRVLRDIARAVRMRGADVVAAGVQPQVAYSMVRLAAIFDEIPTAIDLEDAIEVLSSGEAAMGTSANDDAAWSTGLQEGW